MTSAEDSPPSEIFPVRAVSVAEFEPASSWVTTTEPPTIVTLSLNVELSTSTAPVPLVASPKVIELKPSCRKPNSMSSRLSVPPPPPRPMSVEAVFGLTTRTPLPWITTVSSKATVSVVKVIAPVPLTLPMREKLLS